MPIGPDIATACILFLRRTSIIPSLPHEAVDPGGTERLTQPVITVPHYP